MPAEAPLRDYLLKHADVQDSRAAEVIEFIRADAATAGLVRNVKGADWVDFDAVPHPPVESDLDDVEPDDESAEFEADDAEDLLANSLNGRTDDQSPAHQSARKTRPNAIFVGHGKNKRPREQLEKILNEYGIPYKVAEHEANKGRPIPVKVKETMEECGAAILIFSADEELFDKDGEAVWRPSENVVHELGASSVLYDSRIIVFREETVQLATNYESIGYISFERDDLTAKANDLFRELIALGILKVSVSDD
jgi:predicted nucleotide-binding protein